MGQHHPFLTAVVTLLPAFVMVTDAVNRQRHSARLCIYVIMGWG
jgi:hypothetical protein